MSMREERADMRARILELEGERATLSSAMSHRKVHMGAIGTQADSNVKSKVDEDESLRDSDTSSQDCRMTDLLDKMRRDSARRNEEQEQVIKELRKTNQSLSENLERTRRRYQGRLRRLEQQILHSILKKHFGKTFTADSNSQSVYSCLSTETDDKSE